MLASGLSHTQVTRIELPVRAILVVSAPLVSPAFTSGEPSNGGVGVGLLVVDRVGKALYVNPLHVHAPGVTGTTAAAAASTGAFTSTLAGSSVPLTHLSNTPTHIPFNTLSNPPYQYTSNPPTN